jgi:hypothetical protein
VTDENVQQEGTWNLRIVNSKKLKRNQINFGRMYYWAAFYGKTEIVNYFLGVLGISPFLKTYKM